MLVCMILNGKRDLSGNGIHGHSLVNRSKRTFAVYMDLVLFPFFFDSSIQYIFLIFILF